MSEEFKTIDPATYVDWSKAGWGQKFAPIQAEFVEEGTPVETVMADGHVEATNTAGVGGGYRITNPAGEQYLVLPKDFLKRYEQIGDGNTYGPKWNPVLVMQIGENVSFPSPWGEGNMEIKAGGVLVNAGTNANGQPDVYGIQPDEFSKTYKIVGRAGTPKPETRVQPLQ